MRFCFINRRETSGRFWKLFNRAKKSLFSCRISWLNVVDRRKRELFSPNGRIREREIFIHSALGNGRETHLHSSPPPHIKSFGSAMHAPTPTALSKVSGNKSGKDKNSPRTAPTLSPQPPPSSAASETAPEASASAASAASLACSHLCTTFWTEWAMAALRFKGTVSAGGGEGKGDPSTACVYVRTSHVGGMCAPPPPPPIPRP